MIKMPATATKLAITQETREIIDKSRKIAETLGVRSHREGSRKKGVISDEYQFRIFNFKIIYENLDLNVNNITSTGTMEKIQIYYQHRLVFDTLLHDSGSVELSKYEDGDDWKKRLNSIYSILKAK